MRKEMMKFRKGAGVIFLTVIISSMMILIISFIKLSINIGGVGYSDSVLTLAGRSVMSEFNTHLKDEYGIFAFAGFSPYINEKISRYAGRSIDENKYLDLQKVSSTTAGYGVGDVDVFEDELCDYTKYALVRKLLKESSNGEGKKVALGKVNEGRVLRNSIIKNSLPSEGRRNNISFIASMKKNLNDSKNILTKGSKKYLVTNYIMSQFKNRQNQNIGKDTFFRYEAEYILYGKNSDKENAVAVRRALTGFRNAVNITYILTNEEMRKKVIAAGQIISPGDASMAVTMTLAEAWALAEAKNDVKILESGGRVALSKSKETWAISLKNILNKKKEIIKDKKIRFVNIDNEDGWIYQDYLKGMLMLHERTIKYQRMMDLIQINIQGKYNKDFLIKEHNMGFMFDAKVNDKTYRYEERY